MGKKTFLLLNATPGGGGYLISTENKKKTKKNI